MRMKNQAKKKFGMLNGECWCDEEYIKLSTCLFHLISLYIGWIRQQTSHHSFKGKQTIESTKSKEEIHDVDALPWIVQASLYHDYS